jgi:hypothetical protein
MKANKTDVTGLTGVLSNSRSSALVLVLANSLPLFGVWFFDWSIFDVVFLYWAENVVIGIINIMRMVVATPQAVEPDSPQMALRRANGAPRFFLIPFFAVHYGMFCYGHQVFLVDLFGDGRSLMDVLADSVIWVGIAGIAASHLYSFVTNFLLAGEYRRTDAKALMTRPYGRIVILHVTIIVGSFLYQAMGEPILLLLVLIVIKTLVDLKQHGRERTVFAPEESLRTAP